MLTADLKNKFLSYTLINTLMEQGSKLFSNTQVRTLFYTFTVFYLFATIKHLVFKDIAFFSIYLNTSLCILVGIAFFHIRASELPKPYTAVLRTSILVFTVYWVFSYCGLPLNTSDTYLVFEPLRWLTIVCGVIAFFRPSFGLLPFLYTTWSKRLYSQQIGISISNTDYAPVMEIGFLLVLGVLVYQLLNRSGNFFQTPKASIESTQETDISPLMVMLYFGIAAHFANYFFSGMQKYWLDHSWIAWVLENKTHYLVLSSKLYGSLPISKLLDAFPNLYQWITVTTPAINIVTFVGQLAAIVAILRFRWITLLTIIFDLFHVGVFILSGIFFWKWMLFNLSIAWSSRSLKAVKIPLVYKITAVIIMLMASKVFFTARLGWYDTSAPVHISVQAITKDNKVYDVPSNYFLGTSITVAQDRIGWPIHGHFPTKSFGTTKTLKDMQLANNCSFPLPNNAGFSEQGFNTFQDYIRRHHRFILSQVDAKGLFNYDLYPHHIWSNPAEYTSFKQLDKRNITGYQLVAESVCLGFDSGQMTKRVLAKSVRPLKLP
jgi:hypothetical protein